jgi:Domain of unknown function (DUF4381)
MTAVPAPGPAQLQGHPATASPTPMAPGATAPGDPLAELRGYHLPEPVGWWPPAPGWWVLTLLVLLGAGAAAARLWRRRRRRAAARRARQELAALRAELARSGDATAFARGLSRLLRRFALARFPRRRVAGLTGAAWLAFLDAQGGGEGFRHGPGRLLAEAPYRPAGQVPAGELAALAEAWIAHNLETRP